MDWYWHFVIHAIAVYGSVGFYLGNAWAYEVRNDPTESAQSKFWATLLIPLVAMFLWPCFVNTEEKAKLSPKMKNHKNQAIRAERKRLAYEVATETAKVEVLEMSADHRKTMQELDARRKAAEEVG